MLPRWPQVPRPLQPLMIPGVDVDGWADLIGRESECARVATALAADRPIWVVGEPGIGKTTLVRAAVARSGRRLHEGAGIATLGPVPFHALPREISRESSGDAEQVAGDVERAVGPDVLFVDDAHWADHDSCRAIARLAGRVALVVASRHVPTGELREVPWVHIEIAEIDAASAASIARHILPSITSVRLARILDRAAGNPLLIEELVRDGNESPTMRRAMADRVAGLSPMEQRLLWLLVLAGKPIAVTRLPAGIDELTARSLVAVRAGEAQLRHAVLRDAIQPLIPADEQPALRRELARLVDDPLEIAGFLLDAGDPAEALDVAAPALAGATLARRAALLEILAASAPGATADTFRLDAARAYRDLGEDEAVARLMRQPIEGDPEARALRDALLGDALWSIGQGEAARRVLEQAPAAWPPATAGELELTCARARQLVFSGSPGAALNLLDEALATAGTLPSAYRTTTLRAAIALFLGRTGALEPLRGAWAAARAAGDEAAAGAAAQALHNALLCEAGASEAAAFAHREGERQYEIGLPARGTVLLTEAVQSYTFAGDITMALELGDRVLERAAPAVIRHRATLYFAHALTLAGRLDEAARVRRLLWAPFPNATQEADRLDEAAEAAYWEGRTRRCLELSAVAAMLPRQGELNRVLPALVRSWAQVDAGRQPDPVPPAGGWACLAGATAEADGLRALFDAPAGARDRFGEAAVRWAPFMAPREAVCLWAAGEAARRAGHADAPDLLRVALDRAEAMGFVPLAARVRRSLRLAGKPVGRPSGKRGRALPLTAREQQILDLVSEGLTNSEIARRMGLGRPTVAQALSRVMARLRVDSRAQAISAANVRPAPPIIVVDDQLGAPGILAEVRSRLIGSGWTVVEGFGRNAQRPAVLAGTVDNDQTAAAALLAALDGHGLLLLAACSADTAEQLLADLRRVGPVTRHARPADSMEARPLRSEEWALLDLIARGHSVDEAACCLGMSSRTADRRLAQARAALGATTTAGAVGEASRRGWLPPPACA